MNFRLHYDNCKEVDCEICEWFEELEDQSTGLDVEFSRIYDSDYDLTAEVNDTEADW